MAKAKPVTQDPLLDECFKSRSNPETGRRLGLRQYVCRNSLMYRVLRAVVKRRKGIVRQTNQNAPTTRDPRPSR